MLVLPADAGEEAVKDAALASEKGKAAVGGRGIGKMVYVPGRVLNAVTI